MIPEFLVILTNCISDYWIVSPQKNGANLPPTGQFALQNKLDLALWAFRPQKFLKLPGTIGFNILTQWLNVGYFQYIRLQGKFKYFTNNINDISIFISYNKVHPDMWHNQLYSIHTHIYIYIPVCHTIIYYIPLLFGIPQQTSSGVVVQLVVDLHVPGRQGHGQKVDHQRWAKVAQAMNTLVPSSLGPPLQSCCKKI